jgi:hypothetical protein
MRTALVALAVVLLSSCGGGEGEPKPETEQAPPKVSTATTCGQLFDGDAPIERTVDLMTAEASAADGAGPKAEALAEELDPIAAQAGEEVGPHVDVVATELREYAAVKAGESFETDAMVTSLTELNNVCGVTPRF